MITENRWKHIVAVARLAREFALKMRPNDTEYAQDMFLLGLTHDIGYEFLGNGRGHAALGGQILKRAGYKYWDAVANHGYSDILEVSDELFILNCADMSVDLNGNRCTMDARLADIAARHGADSDTYHNAVREIDGLKSDPRYKKLK